MRRNGFTLLETMVVIGILAVLLGIGIPAFNQYKSNQTMRSTLDTLVSMARAAREQAHQHSDGTIFAGPIPGTSPGNGDVDVESFAVIGGVPTQQLQQFTIQAQFAPSGQNLPTASQVTGAGDRIGAIMVFTGTHGQQVLAFTPNGSPVQGTSTGTGTPVTGVGVHLTNQSLVLDMVVSSIGDVTGLQNGTTGLSTNQQAIINLPPTAF